VTTELTVPISAVQLGEAEVALVLEVLRSGHLAQGPFVERLEAAFAEIAGVRHAIAVNNGTTALVAAVAALDVRHGDEIVTTPFTFAATLNAILEAGAVARFADIEPDGFNIDPAAVAEAVGPRTVAVLPVHLFGLCADMVGITDVARDHGLAVIEDAAQAHGATIGAQVAGSFGLAGCFSFYATKNVTLGEGGIITTDDDALADRLRVLRNQGMRRRYEYVEPGHNWRLSDLHAAIGIPQLARLADTNERRRRNAALLEAGLAAIPWLARPATPAGFGHVFHQYTVRVRPGGPVDRDGLARALQAVGIGCGVYYPRVVFDHDCYRAHPGVVVEPMPRAAAAAREVLSLPVHPGLAAGDVERIVEAVRGAFGQ
jgi:perosamine synthetase